MFLDSDQLDAFFALVQFQTFTKAAKALRIGQPALSQRIKSLESGLKLTLLERTRMGVRPTEAGIQLLRYCQQRKALEEELREHLQSPEATDLSGSLRLGGSSTVMSSVAIPALAQLLNNNPKVKLELLVRQYGELPEMLVRGKSDFILLDRPIEKRGVTSVVIGEELFAVFAAKERKSREDLYFDTYDDDRVTENFFKFQKQNGHAIPKKFRRDFTGDVYVMLEAVRQGCGRAVLPIHLAVNDPLLMRVDPYPILYKEPVVLNYVNQEFPSVLKLMIISQLKENAAKILLNTKKE